VTPRSRTKPYSIKRSLRISPTTPDRTTTTPARPTTPATRTAAVLTPDNPDTRTTVHQTPQATRGAPALQNKQSKGRQMVPPPTPGLAVEPNLVHTHTITETTYPDGRVVKSQLYKWYTPAFVHQSGCLFSCCQDQVVGEGSEGLDY
jgi:hypothetical protein